MPARHTFFGSSPIGGHALHPHLHCCHIAECKNLSHVTCCWRVIWRQCQLWIHFCDGCVHTHSKYVLWHITICMHKAWGRKQCVSHGNIRAVTKSSKCGSEILHIHLEECHTSHCRARTILQTLFNCSRKTWLDSCSLVTSRLIPSTHASFFFTRRMCFCNVVTPNRCRHNGLVTSPRQLERKACEWNDQNR